MLDLIRSLALLPGPSGHEEKVADFIRSFAQERGWVVKDDPLGNLIVFLGRNRPQKGIALMAHMDEVCLFVRRIDENGFIRIEKTGGMTERDFYGHGMIVLGKKGPVFGIIGTKPNHLITAVESRVVPPATEMYMDIGALTRDEAIDMGVYVGAPVVFTRCFYTFKNRLFGTALDNRAGIAVVLETLGHLWETHTPSIYEKVCAIFSVQEELIFRGGISAVRDLAPRLIVAVDAVVACDTPELAQYTEVGLGKGPVVNRYTFHGKGEAIGVVPSERIVDEVVKAAEEVDIDLQYNVMSGLVTDAAYARLEGTGAVAIEIGFPLRYAHGSVELCDLQDLISLKALLTRFVVRMSNV